MAASSLSFSWSFFFSVSFIGLCVSMYWWLLVLLPYNSTFASSFGCAAGFCTNIALVLVRMSFLKEEQQRNVLCPFARSLHRFLASVRWKFDCVRRDGFWAKWATTHITLLNISTIFERSPWGSDQISHKYHQISAIFRKLWISVCVNLRQFFFSLSLSFRVACSKRVETACASLYALFSA